MKKLIFILLFSFLWSTVTFAYTQMTVEETDSPNFVLEGEEYHISSKLSLSNKNQKIEVYFHTDINTSLKNAEYKSTESERQLKFYRIEGNSFLNKIYKIESKQFTETENNIGQLVLTLVSTNTETAQLYVTSVEPRKEYEDISEKIVHVNVYSQSDAAGKSIVLKKGSQLKINIDDENIDSDLLIEFWAEVNCDSSYFFRALNSVGNEITKLSVNSFGYLSIPSFFDAEYFNEIFIDKSTWNYFLIRLNKSNGRTKIYVNDEPYFIGPIYELVNSGIAKLEIGSPLENSQIRIDRLKIWNYKNHEDVALANKNYPHYTADSSKAIFISNFEGNRQSDALTINGRYEFDKSTAPIFSRAPLLRASVFNQSFNLIWEISEMSEVQKFVVEKSYDGRSFNPISIVNVADENKLKFSFSDYDISEHQILYYRVNQVNSDGSNIYSSAVKVGRGKQTHFKVNQNYPNPFNPITTVAVDVKRAAEFVVRVYDIVGNVITRLHEGILNEGTHRFNFNGEELPSGLYFFEVKSEDDLEVMKMILAK